MYFWGKRSDWKVSLDEFNYLSCGGFVFFSNYEWCLRLSSLWRQHKASGRSITATTQKVDGCVMQMCVCCFLKWLYIQNCLCIPQWSLYPTFEYGVHFMLVSEYLAQFRGCNINWVWNHSYSNRQLSSYFGTEYHAHLTQMSFDVKFQILSHSKVLNLRCKKVCQ